jgi:hypothetical protein
MAEERDTEASFLRFVRGCIYNRWFYAFLAGVCLLDVTADCVAMIHPASDSYIEEISLIASAIAAALTATIFLDLKLRRRKP